MTVWEEVLAKLTTISTTLENVQSRQAALEEKLAATTSEVHDLWQALVSPEASRPVPTPPAAKAGPGKK
jgi:hypothetical protein